jgi:hypothetical protein
MGIYWPRAKKSNEFGATYAKGLTIIQRHVGITPN